MQLGAGVAYVKYDKASAAALAVENLHEATLNDGQGPRLKVMLAESPHARYVVCKCSCIVELREVLVQEGLCMYTFV